MIYTDGIHIVADRLCQLHEFCKIIGIKRCWYEGYRKGHPHYDIPNYKVHTINQFIGDGLIKWANASKISIIAQRSYKHHKKHKS
jgi:hypothetical protein